MKKEDRSSITQLEDMKIDLPNGNVIALKEVATYSIERGDVSINHLDGRREIQVSADLKNSEESSPTDIMNDIRLNIMPEIQERYPTVSASYEGQNREAFKLINSVRSGSSVKVTVASLTSTFVVVSCKATIA